MATYYDPPGYIWNTWNSGTTASGSYTTWEIWTSSGTSTSAGSNNCWLQWTTVKGSNSTGETTWNSWNTHTYTDTNTGNDLIFKIWGDADFNAQPVNIPACQPPTAEQLREQEEARQRAREREQARLEEQRLKTEAAKKQAEKLLMSLLNPRQRKEYREKQQISIYRGNRRKWILKRYESYNVLECDKEGKPVTAHCVHPDGVPLEDNLATQYLYLHTNAQELLRIANRQPYRAH